MKQHNLIKSIFLCINLNMSNSECCIPSVKTASLIGKNVQSPNHLGENKVEWKELVTTPLLKEHITR